MIPVTGRHQQPRHQLKTVDTNMIGDDSFPQDLGLLANNECRANVIAHIYILFNLSIKLYRLKPAVSQYVTTVYGQHATAWCVYRLRRPPQRLSC